LILSYQSPIPWFEEFVGVAYRYYDLRMNVVPLFTERKKATNLWHDSINLWNDHSIKIRFVETDDDYWFVMGADSRNPQTNVSFFKMLPISENYKRFKKGHDGEAYLRLGIYSDKYLRDVKNDAICNCGHSAEDHDKNDEDSCLYEICKCKKFESFQINLLKKKKIVTDIKFLIEKDVKNDSLAWNCLNANKYSKTE
jgi:hypothetical protein